jgi:hypothetical protein
MTMNPKHILFKLATYVVLFAFATATLRTPAAWAQETKFSLEDYIEAYEDQRSEGYITDSVSTTVAADSAAGQAVLHVASTTGFKVAQSVVIDEGGAAEEGLSVAEIPDGTSLKFTTNLQSGHTAAAHHSVTGLGVPPPLTDEQRRDLIHAFYVTKYEAAFDLLDGAVKSLDAAYKAQLLPIYSAANRKLVEDAIKSVGDVVAFGQADLKAKGADILTPRGRIALDASAQRNAALAEAAVAHLANVIGTAIADQKIHKWFADHGSQRQWHDYVVATRAKLQEYAFLTELLGYQQDGQTYKGLLTDLLDNYKTWNSGDAAASLEKAGVVNNHSEGVVGDFETYVSGVELGEFGVALAGAILTAVEAAQAVMAINAALGKLFASAGKFQIATAQLAIAGGGSIPIVTVVGGSAVATSVAELLAITAQGAVRVTSVGALSVAMMKGGGGGLPSRKLQPIKQSPKVPKNSNGVDYPDVKYPKGHPKQGQRMEFPDFDSLKEIPKDKRAVWSGAKKSGPIKGRDAYIEEWGARKLPDPPGGWEKYDIHHIRPRQYGGQNEWDNLIPILKDIHNGAGGVSPWWAGFVA